MPLYRPAPPTRHPVCDGVPRLARRIAALTCASGRDHPPPRFFFDARPDDSFRLTAARINALNERSSIASPSRLSIARLVLPSRLELKRPEGSLSDAPLAKVSFTTALYVSPVQISPSCDQTGTPLHFHSSTTSGSACLIRARTRESISPRQSSSSSILASMSRAGDLSFAMPVFFMCFSPSTALRRECLHASALVAQLQCGGAALREDLDIRRIRFATEQLTRAPLGRRDLDGRAPLRVDESKQHCLRIARRAVWHLHVRIGRQDRDARAGTPPIVHDFQRAPAQHRRRVLRRPDRASQGEHDQDEVETGQNEEHALSVHAWASGLRLELVQWPPTPGKDRTRPDP